MSSAPKERHLSILQLQAAILVVAVIAAWLLSVWQRPLGPSLALPTYTPAAPASGDESPWRSWLEATPVVSGPAPAPVAEPVCGGPPSMRILAIGTDYRYENYLYGLADVVKIVRVDFVTPRVMLMDLPRDLYVEIPDIAAHGGITHGKLNQAYLYGNPGLAYYDGPGDGPGLLARTLDRNFGERPDHYLAVNMGVFPRIVDAVGGVDVSVSEWTLGYRPGTHHMSGNEALDFARARPAGTFDRSRHQDAILNALWDRLSDPSTLGHTGDLVRAFRGSVQTDLSPEQINQLTCLAGRLTTDDIVYLQWPDSMFKGARMDDPVLGNTFVWDVDFDMLRLFVAAFDSGQWPLAEQLLAAQDPIP